MVEMAISNLIKRWVDKIAVTTGDAHLSSRQLMLTNHDLAPVEKARRLWGPWNFVAFWVADACNVNTWMISSAMIADGLSWWQAWICVWLGYSIAAAFIVASGRIGAVYHIAFPVACRASFGIWGSLWPVFNRVLMACVWYGVNSYVGGHCVYLMIRSIWTSWDAQAMPGPFEPGVSSIPGYVSFIIFWLCSLPALWFPVHQVRHLFTVKAYSVPPAALAFLIWSLVRAGNVGPIIHQANTVRGTALAWAFVRGVMTSIANFATLIVNDSDFSRFCRAPQDAFWSQLITVPVAFAVTSLIGILVSSASILVYGTPIWDPLALLGRFIDEGGSGERFAVFLIALAFALAQLGTNIAANSVSAGTDLAALLPRFITIRRGSFLCAIVGLAMCPYNLLTSANNFTTYLSAYSVFLSSIAGVMLADYYAVRMGYLEIRALYDANRAGPYYFTVGIHWRAYAAYLAGIAINVVGFAGAVGQDVPQGAMYLYNLNFFCGFVVSSLTYWGLCRLSPVPATSSRWLEVDENVDVHPCDGKDRTTGDRAQFSAEEEEKHTGDKVSSSPTVDMKAFGP